MPAVFADGKTIEACARETLDALTTAVATMLEIGQRPPSPASDGKREQQVNIRLTADERLRIEEAARAEGFRSVSDYIRAASLRGWSHTSPAPALSTSRRTRRAPRSGR